MNFVNFGQVAALMCSVSMAVGAVSKPVQANDLKNVLLGVGGAIILNEVIKNEQAKAQPRQPQTSQSQRQRQTTSAPVVTNVSINRSLPQATQRNIQVHLNNLGFDAGVPDGVWGPRTQRAFVAFESSVGGTTPDGRVDEGEIALLSSLQGAAQAGAGSVAPAASADVVPAAAGAAGALPVFPSATSAQPQPTPVVSSGPLPVELVPYLPSGAATSEPYGLSYSDFDLGVYRSDDRVWHLVVSRQGAYLQSQVGSDRCIGYFGDHTVDDLFYLKHATGCYQLSGKWISLKGSGSEGAVTVHFPSGEFPDQVLKPVHDIPTATTGPGISVAGIANASDYQKTLQYLTSKGGTSKEALFDLGTSYFDSNVQYSTASWSDANFKYYGSALFPVPVTSRGRSHAPVAIMSSVAPQNRGSAPYEDAVLSWLKGLYGTPSYSEDRGNYHFWLYNKDHLLTPEEFQSRDQRQCPLGGRRTIIKYGTMPTGGNLGAHRTELIVSPDIDLLGGEPACTHAMKISVYRQTSGQLEALAIELSDLTKLALMRKVEWLRDPLHRIIPIDVPAQTPHGGGASAMPVME